MTETKNFPESSLSFRERAEALVSQMSLDEKVGQLLYNSPAIPRLGIPFYNWWNEALHGVARAGVATMFPQAIGLAASFDEEFLRKIADVIATEGRAKHHEYERKGDRGIYKGLTFWSPNINIFRDPRWGRGHETYGEDPYLTSRLGVGFIKGLQGDDEKYLKTAACAKHYAVHSGPEDERHSFNAVVTEKDLRETYLPAFRAAVTEAKVEGVMGAYNRTNDEPCCGSKRLLVDILRGEWEFDGYVTSDCWAIKDFHMHHHVTSTAPESVSLAVSNGCDLNCGNMYGNLLIAVAEGLIEEAFITESCTRLMTTRMRLGMFDPPEEVKYTAIPYELNDCGSHRDVALEAARRSLVLLKNDGTLPLAPSSVKTIAVIGPNADSRRALIGNYYGTPSRYKTVLEGIREVAGDEIDVLFSEGCHLHKSQVEDLAMMLSEDSDRLAEAASVIERADAVVLVVGLDESLEGEEGLPGSQHASGDKQSLDLPGLQPKLMSFVLDAGKPVIVVNMSGSAMNLCEADERAAAVIQAWYPGAEGGLAVAEAIFGDINPSGRLPVTFYRSTEDLPDFKDYSMSKRTYRYFTGETLYPFGYGLGYSRFEYKNLQLFDSGCCELSEKESTEELAIPAGSTLKAKVTVTNTGAVGGISTAQVYLADLEATVKVPRWALAGIKPVYLEVGETKELCFEIGPRQMVAVNEEGRYIIEPGMFRLYVGDTQPDARSVSLSGAEPVSSLFTVNGTLELPF